MIIWSVDGMVSGDMLQRLLSHCEGGGKKRWSPMAMKSMKETSPTPGHVFRGEG